MSKIVPRWRHHERAGRTALSKNGSGVSQQGPRGRAPLTQYTILDMCVMRLAFPSARAEAQPNLALAKAWRHTWPSCTKSQGTLVVFLSLPQRQKNNKQTKKSLFILCHRAEARGVPQPTCPTSAAPWPQGPTAALSPQQSQRQQVRPKEPVGTHTAPRTGPAHTSSCPLRRFQMCCLFTIFDDYK